MPAVSVAKAFDLAVQHHNSGRLAEAESIYRQILFVKPSHAGALHLLGVIAHQTGHDDLAVEWIRRSIDIDPSNADAHSNMGEAYRAIGRLNEAVASYRRAVELRPDFSLAHSNLGIALAWQGKLEEAVASYLFALRFKPDMPDTHNNLGIALKELGRLDEAVTSYRRALELRPSDAEAHNNLGAAFAKMGRTDEAIAAYRCALEIRPDMAVAHKNLGIALRDQGRFEEAVAAFCRTLELRPNYPDAHNELGIVLSAQGRPEEAIAEYECALRLKPDFAKARNNLGKVLKEQGRLDEAAAAYARVRELDPDMFEAQCNLGNVLRDRGQCDEAMACYRRAVELTPEHPLAYSNLIYTLHFHPDCDPAKLRAEQRRWNRQFGQIVGCFGRPHPNDRSPERRLRIGYVSPDFCDHVVGRNILPLLERHDRERFEVLCYSGAERSDWLTERFRAQATGWRSTLGLSDERLDEAIRHDGVDILVDLAQHLAGNRLTVFARQSAPVQVSFAGYPESTGVEAIEYRITDRWLEAAMVDGKWQMENGGWEIGRQRESDHPTAISDPQSAEQVFLIDSFWCYDPCGIEVAVTDLPAKENGRITFGSLNNFCKLNDRVLSLWARVISDVRGSRLVLLSEIGSHRQRTVKFLAEHGVEPDKVEFVRPCARQHYLELYQRVDIALDPFPYGGHTTSLDALWMGVPVVSLAGERAVSRAGLSILSNLGLPELVAFLEDDFVRIAIELAGNFPRLEELRRTLRSRMEASVLMDAPRFARNIEAAFRQMWRRWCTGVGQ